jgi:hypothetical protein
MTAGYVIEDVGFIEENTLYTYIGNLFVWLAIAAVVGVIVADLIVRTLDKSKR